MNDTIFYVLGIGLVVAALTVAAIGIRFERFPASRGLMAIGTLLFASLVVATATFAWRNAEDEQADRNAEHAAEEQAAGGGEQAGTTTSTTSTTAAPSVDGSQVFADQQCGGCHTLAAAGTSGTVGPVLDSALKGKDQKFIETSIVDPNAFIEKGFPPDTMPQTYGESLSPEEINALVKYLFESTNSKG